MDADVVAVPVDAAGRLTGDGLRVTVDGLDPADRARVFALVATSGTTNAGVVDDLAAAAEVDGRARDVAARRRRLRRCRPRGAERARPLRRHRARRQLHRRPAQVALRAVRLLRPAVPRPATRPARRTPSTPSTSTCCTPIAARPASSSTTGTPRTTPTTSPAGPAGCRCGSAWRPTAPTPTATPSRPRSTSPAAAPTSCVRPPHLELLVEPELSVVLFRRLGWGAADYQAWSDRVLARGTAFVTPTLVGRRDRAAVVHRQPADHRRRPRPDRRAPRRWLTPPTPPTPPTWSSPAPAASPRWTPTGTELDGGWVAITGGRGLGRRHRRAAAGQRRSSTPPTASSHQASSTPTTTCSRT